MDYIFKTKKRIINTSKSFIESIGQYVSHIKETFSDPKINRLFSEIRDLDIQTVKDSMPFNPISLEEKTYMMADALDKIRRGLKDKIDGLNPYSAHLMEKRLDQRYDALNEQIVSKLESGYK